jgi:hypothetical protein
MREPEQWCFTAIGKLCMIGTKMKGGNQKLLISIVLYNIVKLVFVQNMPKIFAAGR